MEAKLRFDDIRELLQHALDANPFSGYLFMVIPRRYSGPMLVACVEIEIEHLREQIEKLRRMLFVTRSEKLRRQVEEAEALLKQQAQQSDLTEKMNDIVAKHYPGMLAAR
ncbi:Transposase C of IS166 homeodomain [Serratia fonticola]|uniref:Transposase C of IS166 homeodomain n=1 Tax=Serratia fonticola TaxID=47917 RepID=A0A3S4XA73_SERFO|nr:Transposase C of IS166 homeodomain [Serratia fonticola]